MSERDDAPRPDARADAGPRELDLFDLAAFVWTQKLVAILVAVLVFLPLAGLAAKNTSTQPIKCFVPTGQRKKTKLFLGNAPMKTGMDTITICL